MLSNAFSKSINLAYREAFHSLLCCRNCLRVKMWSEHERPRRKPACSCQKYSSSLSANLVWMILLKTLLRYWGAEWCLFSWCTLPNHPFLGNLTRSPVFHVSGIISLSCISLNMCIKRHGVSVPSAFSPSVLYWRWNLHYLYGIWPI